jgi:hypothetical protein
MEELKKRLYENAQEYGDLHSEDCCVNFEDSRACDGDEGMDCCPNMIKVAAIIDYTVEEVVKHLSYDMQFESEKQRTEAVIMYLESYLNN